MKLMVFNVYIELINYNIKILLRFLRNAKQTSIRLFYMQAVFPEDFPESNDMYLSDKHTRRQIYMYNSTTTEPTV